ncbi:unnamed protein product, partial [Polarella glacialis]
MWPNTELADTSAAVFVELTTGWYACCVELQMSIHASLRLLCDILVCHLFARISTAQQGVLVQTGGSIANGAPMALGNGRKCMPALFAFFVAVVAVVVAVVVVAVVVVVVVVVANLRFLCLITPGCNNIADSLGSFAVFLIVVLSYVGLRYVVVFVVV